MESALGYIGTLAAAVSDAGAAVYALATGLQESESPLDDVLCSDNRGRRRHGRHESARPGEIARAMAMPRRHPGVGANARPSLRRSEVAATRYVEGIARHHARQGTTCFRGEEIGGEQQPFASVDYSSDAQWPSSSVSRHSRGVDYEAGLCFEAADCYPPSHRGTPAYASPTAPLHDRSQVLEELAWERAERSDKQRSGSFDRKSEAAWLRAEEQQPHRTQPPPYVDIPPDPGRAHLLREAALSNADTGICGLRQAHSARGAPQLAGSSCEAWRTIRWGPQQACSYEHVQDRATWFMREETHLHAASLLTALRRRTLDAEGCSGGGTP